MDTVLTPIEIRVLGCLIEKEATTPDSYPLSLNALTNACNQKTNREPVMSLSENTVLESVESLVNKTLASQKGGASSRVSKYAHRLTNRLLEEYEFSPPELAALCVLFLRGPQTAGEIRIRAGRIYAFKDTAELDATLNKLAEREDGPFVVKLPRQAGRKESRYAHLLGGEVEIDADSLASESEAEFNDEHARIAELEFKVNTLRAEVDELKQRLDTFISQFE